MRKSTTGSVLIAALVVIACQEGPTTPRALLMNSSAARDRSTGDTPNYNLEVLLRPAGSGDGFGHVKFRQPGNDNAEIIYLDVWVRNLEPNTEYLLQRAVRPNPTGACTTTSAWLTLGKGLVPQSITTDDKGTGREDLFRILTSPPGSTFDIRFQVVRKDTPTVPVLQSECYQFSVK